MLLSPGCFRPSVSLANLSQLVRGNTGYTWYSTPGEELNRAFSLLVLDGQSLDYHCSLSSQELI